MKELKIEIPKLKSTNSRGKHIQIDGNVTSRFISETEAPVEPLIWDIKIYLIEQGCQRSIGYMYIVNCNFDDCSTFHSDLNDEIYV